MRTRDETFLLTRDVDTGKVVRMMKLWTGSEEEHFDPREANVDEARKA
jgi:hypothetical protein